MLRKLARSRLLSSGVVGAGLLVVAGIAGVADTSTPISGCENVYSGVIRLLPSSLPVPFNTTCNTTTTNKYLKEVAISWNQAGAQGLQGVPGLTGATGAQGPQGLKGDTGAAGAQGPQGLKGDTGAAGAQGPQGLKGDTGIQGIQGPKGDNGAAGTPGANGNTGPAGPAGPAGPTGPTGPSGGSLSSLDSLSGVPCNLSGGASAGTISVSYDPTTHAASLTCVPGNQTVTVTVTSRDVSSNTIPTPGGLVSSQPSGINCPTSCSTSVAFNSSVTLIATTPSGWSFLGWGGSCSSFGRASSCVLSNVSAGGAAVTADFLQGMALFVTVSSPQYQVCNLGSCSNFFKAASVTVSDGASFSSTCNNANFAGIAQVGDYNCTYFIAAGTSLTLTPAAGTGPPPIQNGIFAHWSGDCNGTSSPCTITMTQPGIVKATFG